MVNFIRNLDSNYIFILGVILGSLITYLFFRFKPKDGILYIDTSDKKTDKYLLQFNDLDKVNKSKYVMLKIDKETVFPTITRK